MKLIAPLIISISALALGAAEVSVFGAGDINSPSPYGLTKEEKLILENKKEIQNVVLKNGMQNEKVQTVTERLDGLQSIVEGLTQTTNEQNIAIKKLTDFQTSFQDDAKSSTQEKIEQANVIQALKSQAETNAKNITELKTLIEQVSVAVDSISKDYVTKEQFNALITQLKIKDFSSLKTNSSSKPEAASDSSKDPYKEGKKLFSEKKYEEAQSYFEKLIQQKVKVPEAYFFLGETFFERKMFKEAVGAYKESASRNEKALYLPTLLLHSGISMEKTGSVGAAKAFYQATVSKYSGSGAAKEASERLSKLK